MEKIFLDTNVIIDFIEKRTEKYEYARRILRLANKNHTLFVSSLTIINTVYLTKDKSKIHKLVPLLRVIDIKAAHLIAALELPTKDYEETVQYLAAREYCNSIITNDIKGFSQFYDMNTFTPKEYLSYYLSL